MSGAGNGHATTDGSSANHDDKPSWESRLTFPPLPESHPPSGKLPPHDELNHRGHSSAALLPGQDHSSRSNRHDVSGDQKGQHPAHGEHHEVAASVYLTPPQILDHVADAGGSKARNPIFSELLLGILAGVYIGFGFSTCMLCAGQLSEELRLSQPGLFNMMFGIFGFPFGLTLCVVAGASLFTSNVLYMTSAFWQGKAKWYHVLYILVFTWFANLSGALLLAGFMVWGQVFEGRAEFSLHLAEHKTSYPFQVAFVKGVLCNWLVCLAVWQANGANDITGKAVAIWLPISAFVAMGFEHCIANQFVLPLSMMLGSDITFYDLIVGNLIPVTLGNLVGGGLFVATFYCLALGNPGKAVNKQVDKAWQWGKGKVKREEAFNSTGNGGAASSKEVVTQLA